MSFLVNEYKFGKYRGLMIVDPVNRHHIDILPGYGALIARMELFGLELVMPIASHGELEGSHYHRNFWLMPFQNRIRDGKYQFKGQTYQLEVNEKARNTSLHGFVEDMVLKDVSWTVVEDAVTVVTELSYDGGKPGYPFPFQCTFSYEIRESGEVILHYQVRNTGDQEMPFTTGWHPYFQLDGDRAYWKIQSGPLTHHPTDDDRSLPTGETVKMSDFDFSKPIYDHSMEFDAKPYDISMSSERYTLNIQQSDHLRFVHIFTPEPFNSVAIESVSSGVDAFNTGIGLVEIAPGAQQEGQINLQLQQK